MDDLNRMATFAEVVRRGSLSAAARHLGVSPSAVSQQVRALERDYRIQLLTRTTRKLSPTATGARFAEHCQALLDAAERARAQLQQARRRPEGELRITAPIGFGRFLGPALAPLLAEHPDLSLYLHTADEQIDLIDARIDLAIRIGVLPDSDWVAQPLFRLERRVCVAPSALPNGAVPTHPEEIEGAAWIGFGAVGQAQTAMLHRRHGEPFALTTRLRFAANSMATLRELCVAGLGFATLVTAEARDDLDNGRLLPLFDGWLPAPLPVWAVTPSRDRRPARVTRAIAALRDSMLAAAGTLP